MKNYVINNGSFTAAGNFSGYTALGERVHIYARQMDSLGWTTNEDVKDNLPFFCIGALKEINNIDANGAVISTDQRLTALSVFKTRQDITNAHTESAFLDVEIKKSIAEEASKVGLSETAIESLLSNSI
jgi:hypothetical protein